MTSGTGEDGGHRVPDVFECFFERGGAEPNPDIRENREGGGVGLDKIRNLNIQTNKKINICLLNF